MKTLLILLLSILITACGTPVTQTQIQQARFVEPPSENEAKQQVKDYLSDILIDPQSLLLSCSTPLWKGWAREHTGAQPYFGHILMCKVNSKNKFGGYTGQKPFIFIFNGNKMKAFNFSEVDGSIMKNLFGIIP